MQFYRINHKWKRIEIYFSKVPSVAERNKLKQRKWSWDPENKCWFHAITDDALAFAQKNYQIESDNPSTSPKTESAGKYGPVVWNVVGNTMYVFGLFNCSIPDAEKDQLLLRPWDAIKDSVEEIQLSPGIRRIGKRAYYGFENLKKVSVGDTLEEIGERAFAYCKQLSNFGFSPALKVIEMQAFRECTSLKNVIIADSVKRISGDAFKGCTKEQNIVLPKSAIIPRIVDWSDCFSEPQDIYVFSQKTIARSERDNFEVVTAKILCANRSEPSNISVIYDKKRHLYFINEASYNETRIKRGLPYLKVHTETKAGQWQTGELRENHELTLMGYTVSATSGMNTDGRQLLLMQILDGGFLTKAEVVNHIEWLIHFNGNQTNMMNAVAEWRADLAFLQKYKIDRQRSIWVKSFQRKNHKGDGLA